MKKPMDLFPAGLGLSQPPLARGLGDKRQVEAGPICGLQISAQPLTSSPAAVTQLSVL